MIKRRMLCIGLEAAEPSIIDAMIDDGALPNLAAMRRQGSSGRLHSCTEVSSGATWASVNTGVNPAGHGITFYHRQLKAGSYRIRKRYANEIAVVPFWEPLSQSGLSVAVIDIPVSYPATAFSGTMMVGWGAEGLNWKQCSKPASLLREVKQRFGRHPLETFYQARPKERAGWEMLARTLAEATRQRNRVYRWLLGQQPYDLFFAGYPEPHWVGHFFWFLRDRGHPQYDEELARSCGRAVEEVYAAVDEGIGLFRQACPDADMIVFSNTGMGLNYSGLHLLPEILNRCGYGGAERGRDALARIKPYKAMGPYAIKRIEAVVGPALLRNARRCFPERLWDDVTRRFLDWGNDRAASRAFTLPNDRSGAIRINLRGREPNGTVAPGEEYWQTCRLIRDLLLGAMNPATGEPAVSQVLFTREKYTGVRVDDLADIIVNWRGDHDISALESPVFGRVEGILPDGRTGAHTPYGLLLAAGQHVASDAMDGDRDILDLAPTLFAYFDRPVPDYMDGRALTELF
jgi:predicted AlkP superfamily phosphohydrolase/phosphomutase